MAESGVRLGIIGCGIMGERIIRATLSLDPGMIRLSALWDPDPAARRRLSAELPDLPFVDHAPDVAGLSDVIYVASPPATHLGHARIALGAGRAVFTEKPLAVSIEESHAFLELVNQSGSAAAVNFIFASSPAVASLKGWLADGVIGSPEHLEISTQFAQWPRPWQMDANGWLSRRAEGGFTREVISHFLFLTRRLCGPLKLGSASARYPGGDGAETAIAADLTAGDLPVRLKGGVGTTDQADHNLWTLTGSRGAIRLRDWSTAERLTAEGSWVGDPEAPSHELARPMILKGQVTKLADMVRGQPHDLATVEEALEVQIVVERILASG
ncbi:MAG: Gfo/Idh/MocA family oxidoreductase [Minwuia sp.]|nr:Gfo/Idh/MocA family oxidoreductase [Minwuia sp.]